VGKISELWEDIYVLIKIIKQVISVLISFAVN